MEYYKFSNGVEIPMVGLGTFPLKGEVLTETIKEATSLGYELLDTAIAYDNEKEIGDLIRSGYINTNKVFITSKVNRNTLVGRKKYLYLNRKSINRAYHDSCCSLNVKKINAYLLHMPFDGCSRHYNNLMSLYDKGEVDVIGVSNFDIRELKELYNKCGRWPMMNQTEISPYNTQHDLMHFCQDNSILVQSYSPFGRGNLVAELLNNPILVSIAQTHNKTVGQIVLRFIIQQGASVVARSTNYDRLKSNIDIFNFSLSDIEMLTIASLNQNIVFGVNQINKYKVSPINI